MRSKYLGINMFKIRRKNQFWTFMLDTPLFLCLHHLDAKWENFFCPRVLSQIWLCFKGQNALKVFWRQLRAKYPAESFMLDFSLIRHPSVYESRLDPGKRWKWKYYTVVTRRHTLTLTCVQALVDVIWVECVKKLEAWASNQIIRFVSHQLCNPGNSVRKENQEFRGFFPPFFRATVEWYSSCFPSTGGEGQRSRSVTFFRLTCPRSGWSAGPCCDGWGRCKYPEGTPRWMGVGWAHTAGSWLCLQGATQSRCQRDECGLCSGGPGERGRGI